MKYLRIFDSKDSYSDAMYNLPFPCVSLIKENSEDDSISGNIEYSEDDEYTVTFINKTSETITLEMDNLIVIYPNSSETRYLSDEHGNGSNKYSTALPRPMDWYLRDVSGNYESGILVSVKGGYNPHHTPFPTFEDSELNWFCGEYLSGFSSLRDYNRVVVEIEKVIEKFPGCMLQTTTTTTTSTTTTTTTTSTTTTTTTSTTTTTVIPGIQVKNYTNSTIYLSGRATNFMIEPGEETVLPSANPTEFKLLSIKDDSGVTYNSGNSYIIVDYQYYHSNDIPGTTLLPHGQLFIGEYLDDGYINTNNEIHSFIFIKVVLNPETVLVWNPTEITFGLGEMMTGAAGWENTGITELRYSPVGVEKIYVGTNHLGVIINDSIEWPNGGSLQDAYPEYQGKILRITGYMS